MRNARVFRALLGVEKTVIEGIEFDAADELLVARVRPARGARGRCGVCRRRCGGYDAGEGRRRWRALDAGTMKVFIEADAPRVRCAEHGVVVAHVPWARHGAGHTLAFDQTVAWLVTQCSKTAVTQLMRIAWRTVGAIIARVWADVEALGDRLDGLRRIGIDEISYKRGHRFLTVVGDHDTGRLLWAAPGRDRATLRAFFELLGATRCALITQVSADQADWIAEIVAERCPNAVQCADPFHVVKWATEALDEVRRQAWNDARRSGQTAGNGYGVRVATGDARRFKNARYALWKNPDNLTDRQRDKLAWIAKTDPRLHRAYLLKEGLRHVFTAKGEAGKTALALAFLGPPLPHPGLRPPRPPHHRSPRQDPCRARARPVQRTHRIGQHQIRPLTRIAFGFRSASALIALAMLSLAGHRPTLPGRLDPQMRQ